MKRPRRDALDAAIVDSWRRQEVAEPERTNSSPEPTAVAVCDAGFPAFGAVVTTAVEVIRLTG